MLQSALVLPTCCSCLSSLKQPCTLQDFILSTDAAEDHPLFVNKAIDSAPAQIAAVCAVLVLTVLSPQPLNNACSSPGRLNREARVHILNELVQQGVALVPVLLFCVSTISSRQGAALAVVVTHCARPPRTYTKGYCASAQVAPVQNPDYRSKSPAARLTQVTGWIWLAVMQVSLPRHTGPLQIC